METVTATLFDSQDRPRKGAVMAMLCLLLLLLTGCHSVPAPGKLTYEHRDGESQTTITVIQNENPDTSTRIELPPASVEFGASFVPRLPKSFAHMETILTGAGVLVLLAAGVLAWRTHMRLALIAGLTGGALIAIAATVDRYAWAYGLGLVAGAGFLGWMLWSAYKEKPE